MCKRQTFGLVGLMKVHIEPVAHSVFNEEDTRAAHLRIVKEGGSLFHRRDLEDLALNETDLPQLIDLCKRRATDLKHWYLPTSTGEPVVKMMHCWVTPSGYIEAEILLYTLTALEADNNQTEHNPSPEGPHP